MWLLSLTKKQIVFIGLTIHLLASFFSYGFHQCDELFQVYEFAGYKLGINPRADLPWEFRDKIRSGIEPFFVYSITKIANFFGVLNPFTVSFILRLIQSLIAFSATVLFLNTISKEITDKKTNRCLWLFGLTYWCLPYFHVRLSSENFSSTLFLLGFSLLYNLGFQKNRFYLFLGGLLFGLAFLCRFQISFMIAGFFAWQVVILKQDKKLFSYSLTGLIVAIGLGLLVDYWLYEEWCFSWWKYVEINFFKNAASFFGTEPFYYYITEAFVQLVPPFSIVIICCIVLFWIKFNKHSITWLTLPFIVLHFFVPHKELRFLFPVLNFLPFIVLLYFESVTHKDNPILTLIRSRQFISVFLISNFIVLIVFTFTPANNFAQFLKKVYTISNNKKIVLLYEYKNPYTKKASLNYFENTNIKPINLDSILDVSILNENALYYTEKYNLPNTIQLKNKTFNKVYSNFPNWFSYLNFNGWVNRSTYSIYKKID